MTACLMHIIYSWFSTRIECLLGCMSMAISEIRHRDNRTEQNKLKWIEMKRYTKLTVSAHIWIRFSCSIQYIYYAEWCHCVKSHWHPFYSLCIWQIIASAATAATAVECLNLWLSHKYTYKYDNIYTNLYIEIKISLAHNTLDAFIGSNDKKHSDWSCCDNEWLDSEKKIFY